MRTLDKALKMQVTVLHNQNEIPALLHPSELMDFLSIMTRRFLFSKGVHYNVFVAQDEVEEAKK